ncbi:hypothetical protein ACFVW8_14065 [Streptomyces sp. NPDC058221]|uniref:hypothetical protein n=1 Tax=Streptomyces sp. NPDC058221 TaxID=3346388 RepID=UPI0036E70227
MTTSTERAHDVPDEDCFRSLVRRPPRDEETTEYLAWARLMAQVVDDVHRWAPNFACAVASSFRSLDGLRPYCESGDYESAYTEPLAHAVNFARHFIAHEHPAWLKDLARCEMWSSPMAQRLDEAERKAVKEALGIQERGDKEFVIVGHDVLESLQQVIGYRDMTFVRSAPLMWLLRVPPLDVTPSPEPRPGIVVFHRSDDSVSMSYVPAGGGAR